MVNEVESILNEIRERVRSDHEQAAPLQVRSHRRMRRSKILWQTRPQKANPETLNR